MIARIYVLPKDKDSRERLFLKSWSNLGLSGKLSKISVCDGYVLDSDFKEEQLKKAAEILTNPILEKSAVNQIPADLTKYKYILEIGFLPGVTDNAGHTAKESIADFFRLAPEANLKIYSSKIFLLSGTVKIESVKKIAASLYNPLIERAHIFDIKEMAGNASLPLIAPEVILEKKTPVINVPILEASEEELIKIGQEGILENDLKTGKSFRRGPLALDLLSMKTIKDYFEKLGRNPRDIELEALAQTWSEHCKHTIFANPLDEVKDGLYQTYIKEATNLIRKNKGRKDFCVSVFSDNSGGIVFDEDYLITHKVETHNSPSALDPFGGAITGIVGVNRDAIGFGLGAKPVANVYGFCFGQPEDQKILYKDREKKQKMLPVKRIMEGVIKGVNAGGNCSGIPTISGFVRFDDRYKGKPLVFVGTLGLIPRKINDRFSHEKCAQAGDYVVMIGGRVGADGIHGATFSSVALDANSPATAVQIGDPITQKKLSDAIVKEARAMNLYSSLTDNGAGGLSCSVAEMAKESNGVEVYLEKVPLKYPGLRPWEIWISESQERMTLAVPKKKWEVFRKLMKSRGVESAIIGEFTDSGRCVVKYNNREVMNIDLDFLHHGLPKRELKSEKSGLLPADPPFLKEKGGIYTKILEEMLENKNLCGFSFISEQYDHEVQGGSVLKPLCGRGRINTEAQVFRPLLSSKKGVVLSASLYPSYGDISSYAMTACALDTAVRNIICAGGALSHLAVLDNFCWCSSYDKNRLAQLKSSVKACYDSGVGFGTPFISGKDSMFNDFKGYDEKGKPVSISIPPTLLISALSVIPDVEKVISPEFKNAGDFIFLLGETKDELGASEYYKLLAQKSKKEKNIGSEAPVVNPEKNLKIYKVVERLIDQQILHSALSLASGGLAIALAKASIGGMIGCAISLKNISGEAFSADSLLFSESQGRILVSLPREKIFKFKRMAKEIPWTQLGQVIKKPDLTILDRNDRKIVNAPVKKLHKIYHQFSERMK